LNYLDSQQAKKPPIFIVGLQKSGTSLLNRMLVEQQEFFFAPFKLEGREFWGDDPPFSPAQIPCGRLYQEKQGTMGHHLSTDDFTQSDQLGLLHKLNNVEQTAAVLINKNPYNSVRLSWLRAMFPHSLIVGVFRNHFANVFSLKKKHMPHEGRGLGPENGWWGVKPKDWQKLLNDDLITQIGCQWNSVNQEMLDNRNSIDYLFDYDEMCEKPTAVLQTILSHYQINAVVDVKPFPSRNNEYKEGARLLSANREYQKGTNEFDLSKINGSLKEISKLSLFEKIKIWKVCKNTWKQCLKHQTKLIWQHKK